MDGVLSQEEINALLNDPGSSSASSESELTDVEKDEIADIGNLSNFIFFYIRKFRK